MLAPGRRDNERDVRDDDDNDECDDDEEIQKLKQRIRVRRRECMKEVRRCFDCSIDLHHVSCLIYTPICDRF